MSGSAEQPHLRNEADPYELDPAGREFAELLFAEAMETMKIESLAIASFGAAFGRLPTPREQVTLERQVDLYRAIAEDAPKSGQHPIDKVAQVIIRQFTVFGPVSE
jgi:hypothetical protein